ncbi:hypothetical protein PAMP_012676 [Pampus punctatissimus]
MRDEWLSEHLYLLDSMSLALRHPPVLHPPWVPALSSPLDHNESGVSGLKRLEASPHLCTLQGLFNGQKTQPSEYAQENTDRYDVTTRLLTGQVQVAAMMMMMSIQKDRVLYSCTSRSTGSQRVTHIWCNTLAPECDAAVWNVMSRADGVNASHTHRRKTRRDKRDKTNRTN